MVLIGVGNDFGVIVVIDILAHLTVSFPLTRNITLVSRFATGNLS